MAASKRPPPSRLPSLLAVVTIVSVLYSMVPQVAAAGQKKSADAGGKDNGLACAFMPQLETCIALHLITA